MDLEALACLGVYIANALGMILACKPLGWKQLAFGFHSELEPLAPSTTAWRAALALSFQCKTHSEPKYRCTPAPPLSTMWTPLGHLDTDAVLAKIIHAGKSSLRREASKYKGTCQLPIKAEFYNILMVTFVSRNNYMGGDAI